MTGEELRKQRKARGLEQRELSRVSGVSQKTISAVLHGRVRASRGVERRLVEALSK